MKSTDKVLLGTILVIVLGVAVAMAIFLTGEGEEEPYFMTQLESADGENPTVGVMNRIDGEDVQIAGNNARETVQPENPAGAMVAEFDGMHGGVPCLYITGRVVSEFNEPLAGVNIEAEVDLSMDEIFAVNDFGTKEMKLGIEPCESGSDGMFRMICKRSDDPLRLRFMHDRYVNRYVKVGKIDEKVHDVGEVAMDLGAVVSGFVRDVAGNGISDAEVKAWPHRKTGEANVITVFPLSGGDRENTAATGPDGFYSITGIPEGMATLSASHDEYIGDTREDVKTSKTKEQAQVNFTLQAGHTIAGHVLDNERKPVADARVVLDTALHINLGTDDIGGMLPTLSSRNSSAQTDEEGFFMLKGLREGTHTVRAMAQGFLSKAQENVKTGTNDVLLLLDKGGWVSGRVVSGKTSEPIEEFELEVENDQWDRQGFKVFTGEEAVEKAPELVDAKGAYYIQGLAQGDFSLKVEASGYGDEIVSGLTADPEQGQQVDISLWEESKVSGYVYAPDSSPVINGTVMLSKRKEETQMQGGGMGRRIMLQQNNDSVSYEIDDGLDTKKVSTDENGYFIFSGVNPGDFTVIASHEDHTDSMPLDISVADRGEHVSDLIMKLGVSASIVGTVFDVNGEVKPGAKVKARKNDGEDFFGRTVTADPEGQYALTGLEPGEYIVNLVEPARMRQMGGFATITIGGSDDDLPAGSYSVAVAEGEVSELDLFELQKGLITGRVTEAGKPVPDSTVKLFEAGPMLFMPIQTQVTDENGEFWFEKLLPGDYTVRLDLQGMSEGIDENVTVAEGGEETQDFKLPTGRVTGRITSLATGKPVEGVRVKLEKYEEPQEGDGQPRRVVTQMMAFTTADSGGGGTQTITMSNVGGGAKPTVSDEDGHYEIRFVPDGKYKVVAEGGGYAKREREPVDVKEGKETGGQDLELSRGYNVSGTVHDAVTGDPISFTSFTWGPLGDDGAIKGDPNRELLHQGGQFSLKDLKPGNYRLEVDSTEYEGSYDFTVGDKDLDGLSVSVMKKA